MDDLVREALERPQVIDITTTGRRTGLARRIELVDHVIDGRIYISGRPSPRKRGWIANLEADPRLTLHLKRGVAADLPARGRVITDEAERRAILRHVAEAWRADLETMVRDSPLIEVTIEDALAA
ncbi:MAG TPA: nitroreductase/quinone reductase family protein [Candidatus Limnocylindrales bacterium]|nr:nitroreductase/quinone reductase family protein [Candidatus Limnocylindrales bacterium]